MGVSVVMPVRNEENHLRAAVARVLEQQIDQELELVIAVAPSEDATAEIATHLARDPRVKVIDNPSGVTPAGLNLAIAAAQFEVIVRVDGHGELSSGYIQTAVNLLAETGAANVGGRMHAIGVSAFERAVASAYNSRFGLGGGGFHLDNTPAGPAETVFLGVFRAAALREIGGFDETLHRAQDWELNHRLRLAGHTVYFSPELTVVYRPRSTLRALARQFFTTGQWRREVIRRYPHTASLRYLAPPAMVIGAGLGVFTGVLGAFNRLRILRWAWLLPSIYLAFVAAATAAIRRADPAARLWLPVVLATMHVSWGWGFLRGLGDR